MKHKKTKKPITGPKTYRHNTATDLWETEDGRAFRLDPKNDPDGPNSLGLVEVKQQEKKPA